MTDLSKARNIQTKKKKKKEIEDSTLLSWFIRSNIPMNLPLNKLFYTGKMIKKRI